MEHHEPSLPVDFVDLLAAFGGADVRYLIIGGYAVGYQKRSARRLRPRGV
ncbi:MAG: hypothetical protein JNM38_14015 [Acidobacteria bacterium]|nr:hypothetical protein [Acidobacteriota bacterium]